MPDLFWILQEVPYSSKFPYRILIKDIKNNSELLVLLAQERWPGQKGKIFCIRETNTPEEQKDFKILEQVPIISFIQKNHLITIILDRYKNKRCDFLFIKKKYKNKEGEYEQIFWRTQRGLLDRRTKSKFTYKSSISLTIIVDKDEKYPWKFPYVQSIRKKLPVGDYALVENNEIIAVVERKTFDNLLSNFNNLNIFHKQLFELETYQHSALVIEANYSDFLNPNYVKYFKISYVAKILANLFCQHPNLQIIFAGNRKLAIEWTLNFFKEIKINRNLNLTSLNLTEREINYHQDNFTGGLYYDIKSFILKQFNNKDFSLKEIYLHFSKNDRRIIYNQIQRLVRENILERIDKKGYYRIKHLV